MNETNKAKPGGKPKLMADRDVKALHERYWNGESLKALEEESPYTGGSLGAAFRRLGLPALGLAGTRAKVTLDDPRAVKALALWDSGSTAKASAEAVGISQSVMTRLLGTSGRVGVRLGELNPAWRGGRSRLDRSGYVRVWMSPYDPLAPYMRRKDSTVFEHRLVMARHLGRPLTSDETVHHINGIRDDNRIENLELRVGHHGPGVSLRCCRCGSTDLEPVKLQSKRN